MFIASYFVLFETNGLTREQIFQHFKSKSSNKIIKRQDTLAKSRTIAEEDGSNTDRKMKYDLDFEKQSDDGEDVGTFNDLPEHMRENTPKRLPAYNHDKFFVIGSDSKPKKDNFTLEEYAGGLNAQEPNFSKKPKVLVQNLDTEYQRDLDSRLAKIETNVDHFKEKAQKYKSANKDLKKKLKQMKKDQAKNQLHPNQVYQNELHPNQVYQNESKQIEFNQNEVKQSKDNQSLQKTASKTVDSEQNQPENENNFETFNGDMNHKDLVTLEKQFFATAHEQITRQKEEDQAFAKKHFIDQTSEEKSASTE